MRNRLSTSAVMTATFEQARRDYLQSFIVPAKERSARRAPTPAQILQVLAVATVAVGATAFLTASCLSATLG
jgi:hypothetical protein